VLEQVRQDAKQLLRMDDAHMLQPGALATLNDLATQPQEALLSPWRAALSSG